MTAGLALAVWMGAADAQMVLPGAVQPTPEGASQTPAVKKTKPAGAASRAPAAEHVARGTPMSTPGFATLPGKTLLLNGGTSQITFGVVGTTVGVTRLSLTGEKISNSREQCRVELGGAALALSGLGRPAGAERYQVEFPACPLVFDVLDGAILSAGPPASCDFVEADCRVPTVGLWGPAPADLGPDKLKSLERLRGTAESAVRSNYRALIAATKDRPTIMGYARDQAQFSSSREETCRDYADEGRHGFCATKVTQGRAAELYDRLGTALIEKAARKAKAKARHGG